MISIILNSYNPTRAHLHMTMACMAAIRKFTEPPYELIVVDNTPELAIRDDYNVLQPYTLIQNKKNENVYHSYNQGAEAALGDELFFIQSDVFVHELTINKLSTFLKEWEMVFPQQVPISREDVKNVYRFKDGIQVHVGQRDAGLLAIRRDAFERAGGWDDRFKNILGEAAFYARCNDEHVTWTDRTNAFITHIMAGNNLTKEEGLYNTEMDFDAKLLKKEYER